MGEVLGGGSGKGENKRRTDTQINTNVYNDTEINTNVYRVSTRHPLSVAESLPLRCGRSDSEYDAMVSSRAIQRP